MMNGEDISQDSLHELEELSKAIVKHELVLNVVRRVVAHDYDRLSEEDLATVLLALYPSVEGEEDLDLTKDEIRSAFESRRTREIPRLKEMVEDELRREFELLALLEKEAAPLKEDKSGEKTLLIEAETLGAQLVAEARDLYTNFKSLLMRRTKHSDSTYKPALETMKLTAENLVKSIRNFEEIVLNELFAQADDDLLQRFNDDLDGENSRIDDDLSSKQRSLEKYEEHSDEFLAAVQQLKQMEREISDKLATLAVLDESSMNISRIEDG
ncbi:Hypothetical protein NTJ_11754 [Nesidiocoris tenuis]|uniref:Dynein regulatory complex protein 10 n=1 Tax=Nesidiocoris tenuis TaxID=355587 RepID=A0ABN7B3F7_9HEMI|nr:Hypothetical protein NTJ_11754 [Nesidiocoris tenuis]